jgi:hypothetical protein
MSYAPGFRYDLFISYASDDYDERMALFFRELRVYVARELGKLFTEDSVFHDRQDLNRTPVEWKRTLEQSVESTAILVPFLSPSYATSDYCAKELEWFSEDRDQPLRWKAGSEEVYRICPLLWRALDDVTVQQLAPEIRAAQEQRTASVEELGGKIANALRLMRRSRQTVYIGETDNSVRSKLRDEMSRMGFRVMPDVPMAYADLALVRQLLGEARMAVHFVDGHSGQRAIEAIRSSRLGCQGATVVYEVPGNDLSEEEGISLGWIEEDLLATPATDLRAYDRVRGKNFDQFLQVIEDRLEGLRPVPPTRLGIACEETDRPSVEEIIPKIKARTGFSVICHGLSLFDFKKSRGLLFYWGAAEGRRLRQARSITKGLPKAFFLAPPPKPTVTEAQLAEELGEAIIYRQQETHFSVDDIRPFLQELGWSG